MKKSLLALLCVVGLGVAGLASAQSGDFSIIQRLLNTLEGQMAELKATQPAQVSASGVAQKKTTTTKAVTSTSITPPAPSDDNPIDGNPNPVPGNVVSCAGGGTMPIGSINQTIYCDGSRWARSSLLTNTGSKIGINFPEGTYDYDAMLRVKNFAVPTNNPAYGQAAAIYGASNAGSGVAGTSSSGNGVYARSNSGTALFAHTLTGTAVKASTGNGTFGFYQEGFGRNYLANDLGIGFTPPFNGNPSANLYVAGNVTVNSLNGSGNAYACLDSAGKLFRSNNPCR